MAIVGYARVSTTGQSLDTQLEALSGCEKIFREKISGAKDDRPELLAMLEWVREGDIVQVTKLGSSCPQYTPLTRDIGVPARKRRSVEHSQHRHKYGHTDREVNADHDRGYRHVRA